MTDDGRGLLPDKLFFRIGEVAGLVGVEPHVLRYWEREFRTIRPTKSAKGQRVYSRRDVENLLRVRDLLYGQGFTIAGARKRLRDKGIEPSLVADSVVEALDAAGGANPAYPTGDGVLEMQVSLGRPTSPIGEQPAVTQGRAALVPLTEGVARSAGAPPSDRMRVQLEDLKVEIEAFLEELGT